MAAEDDPEFHLRWLARYFGRADYLPLGTEELESLARSGEPVTVEEGAYLYRQGADARAAFVIQSGEVELARGSDTLWVLGRLGAGHVAGDIEMFLGDPYLASARAVGAVTAFRLRREVVVGEMAEHPRIALRWLGAAFRQLRSCHLRVISLLRTSLKVRLAVFLLEEADEAGEVHLSHDELAALLGVTRPALSRALADLRSRGAVESARRVVRVARPELLQELIGA